MDKATWSLHPSLLGVEEERDTVSSQFALETNWTAFQPIGTWTGVLSILREDLMAKGYVDSWIVMRADTPAENCMLCNHLLFAIYSSASRRSFIKWRDSWQLASPFFMAMIILVLLSETTMSMSHYGGHNLKWLLVSEVRGEKSECNTRWILNDLMGDVIDHPINWSYFKHCAHMYNTRILTQTWKAARFKILIFKSKGLHYSRWKFERECTKNKLFFVHSPRI